MKKFTLIFLFLSISITAQADYFSSSIHSIDFGKGSFPHLIRFDNGRVGFVEAHETDLLTSLITSEENQKIVDIQVNQKNSIYAASTTGSASSFENQEGWNIKAEPYAPSVIASWNSALQIFNKMRKDYAPKGECYNRAHIWAYEEYQRTKLNSMKIFMFFTESYIRRYRFHWWFHVTPMAYVANLRSPRTLDRRYTSGPRQTKTWSDVFVRSRRVCREVKKFDDFWLNQQKEDCYHIHASMYYVIPRELEKRDLTGMEKTEFVESQIKRAYKNGFNL